MGDFNWDSHKAASNLRKHRVSFDEAASVFEDALSQTYFDFDHSEIEDRYVTMGLSQLGRLILVVHTDTGKGIRIISAREPSSDERYDYENTK